MRSVVAVKESLSLTVTAGTEIENPSAEPWIHNIPGRTEVVEIVPTQGTKKTEGGRTEVLHQ